MQISKDAGNVLYCWEMGTGNKSPADIMNNMTGAFCSRLTLSKLEFRPHPVICKDVGERSRKKLWGLGYLDPQRNSKIDEVFTPLRLLQCLSQMDLYNHFILVHMHTIRSIETKLGNMNRLYFFATLTQIWPTTSVLNRQSSIWMFSGFSSIYDCALQHCYIVMWYFLSMVNVSSVK